MFGLLTTVSVLVILAIGSLCLVMDASRMVLAKRDCLVLAWPFDVPTAWRRHGWVNHALRPA